MSHDVALASNHGNAGREQDLEANELPRGDRWRIGKKQPCAPNQVEVAFDELVLGGIGPRDA